MKYRPNCNKMGCDQKADAILSLPLFGWLCFCAGHTLSNLKETERNAN